MNLIPAQPQGGNHVGGGVSLGEHVFDFQAGLNIPFRHAVIPHRLVMFLGQQLFRLSLTCDLHNLKSHFRLQPLMEKIRHDTVAGTDHL